MAKKDTQLIVTIAKEYKPSDRQAIAQEILDYIVERTKKGRGPGNKLWIGKAGKYSKEYAKYKSGIVGRSTSKVDLTLSADMLEAIEVLNTKSGSIKLGFTDKNEAAKAEGNILGTYGRDTPIPGKARPFMNLTEKELAKILSGYPLDDLDETSKSTTASLVGARFAKGKGRG